MKANLFAAVVFCVVSFPVQVFSNSAADIPLQTNEKQVQKIDLNKADTVSLSKSVKGIGKKRAEAIIKYRESHNGFKSIDELAQVPGLGKQFVKTHLAQLQDIFYITK